MEKFYKDANAHFEKIEASGAVVAESLQHIVNENLSYWQRSATGASAFAERLAGTKSVETAVQLYSDFTRSQAEDFMGQVSKVGEFCKRVATQVFQPAASEAVSH